MRLLRRNRLSEEQLKEVLQTLPQMKAPAGLEARLERIVEVQRHEVPHILGSLPLVPAPEDFDARLMRAIHDRRRPIAPITSAPVVDAVMRVNWLNNIMGWAGGALMVVTLAFVIDRSGLIEQNIERLPAPATVSMPATPSGGTVQAPLVSVPTAPGGRRATSMVETEASAPIHASAPQQHPHVMMRETSQPSVVIRNDAAPSMPASMTTERAHPQEQPAQSQPHSSVGTSTAIEEHQQPIHRSAAEMTGEDSVTPESEVPSESVDTGMVDTGGERTDPEKSNP